MSLKAFDLSLPFIIILFIDTDGCFHDPVAVGGDQGGILEFWVIQGEVHTLIVFALTLTHFLYEYFLLNS